MKHLKRFFILVLCVLPCVAGANVATTAGSNLTAWNGNSGATNNNNWNTLMNNRTLTGGATAKADFGNCNSLILRCAQPKCSACTTMELAVPVVSGCVNSSKDCKKHGDELVQYIAAQIVANAAAKLQEQQLAMQQAQAQAAAAQNSQQMAQMQQQMAQMQQEMQQQNATQMAQMQAALEEQKALVAQAQQEAAAAQQAKIDAQTAPGVTVAQQAAIESGVSKDTLVRQQIGGEILSTVENAEAQLTKLKETMDEIFSYAKCDARGNNCSGPKRVKMFKEKAMQFFDPYDVIADEMYDALETALAVGVDVSDVIMMLSGSCNKWGKYMCTASDGEEEHKPVAYKGGEGDGAYDDCGPDGKSMKNGRYSRGGFECRDSQIIPPQDDVRCTLIGMISDSGDDDDTVERNWLSEQYDGDKFIRVGCASSALDSIAIFGRRKSGKNRALDLDTLERIIVQDAPEYGSSNRYSGGGAGNAEIEKLKYCALTPNGYTRLRNAVTQKKMPDSKVCVSDSQLTRNAMGGFVGFGGVDWNRGCSDYIDAINEGACNRIKNVVKESVKSKIVWEENRCKFIENSGYCYFDGEVVERKDYVACTGSGGKFQSDGTCNCGDSFKCEDNACKKCIQKARQTKSAASKEYIKNAKKVCEDMDYVFIDNGDDGVDCISKAEKDCRDKHGYWDTDEEECEYEEE